MADIGHKLLPRALQLPQPREVVEHQHGARANPGGVPQGDRVHLQHARRRPFQAQLMVEDCGLLAQPGGDRRDFMMPDRL